MYSGDQVTNDALRDHNDLGFKQLVSNLR